MSLVSINQPYRKAMVNNKYHYQDNHQSYSFRPDTVGNILKPFLWGLAWIICLAKIFKLGKEGRFLEKVLKIFFCNNCTFREALSCIFCK